MKKIAAIKFAAGLLSVATALAQATAPATPGLSLSLPTPAPSPAPAVASAQPVPTAMLADPKTAFAAGVAAYEKNEFARAREFFAGAEAKSVSAPLEFNFGNACFQANDYGAAVLHYLRALTLSPRDPDALQNLALARKAANISLPDPDRLESFSALLEADTWAWIATLAGWAAVYLAILPRLYRWRGAAPWSLCGVMALMALAAGAGFFGAHGHAHDGVVLHADTPIKLSPTANSPAIGAMQAGEVAATLEEHNGYFKVRVADGRLGWLDGADYSPVWN